MSEYPFTYAGGTFPLMNDDDLERLVCEKCGDEIGGLLHRRLYGNYDTTTLQEQIDYLRDAQYEADHLSSALDDLLEYFKKLKHQLPAGGVIET